jgi:tetratricopeptide (TPR) repeat protein
MAALFEEQQKLLKWIRGRRAPTRLRQLEKRGFALRGNDPREAVRILRKVLEHEPDRIPSLRACGRVLLQLREYEKARPLWERLEALIPDEVEPHLQLARIHLHANRMDESGLQAAKVLAINPLHSEARLIQARVSASSPSSTRTIDQPAAPAAAYAGSSPPAGTVDKGFLASMRRLLGLRSRPVARTDHRPVAVRTVVAALPATARRRADAEALIAAADRQAELGDMRGLIDALDDLAGLVGPTPAVVAALVRHRRRIDAALARTDGEMETKVRLMLTVKARRLWTFLPDPALHPAAEPATPTAELAPASLIAAAERLAGQGDIRSRRDVGRAGGGGRPPTLRD